MPITQQTTPADGLFRTETERVLVVPTSLFRACGWFQGFCGETEKYLTTLLDPAVTQYLPRGDMEQDPSFKQLIPYCVFRHTDASGTPSVFQYTRGSKQGESRLHSKRSIGIGGHVSALDVGQESPYAIGMNRELEEEVMIDSAYVQSCVGLLNDDSNEVGQVHLGVVHLFDVAEPNVSARESGIVAAGFRPIAELQAEIDKFETWSQICLNALFS